MGKCAFLDKKNTVSKDRSPLKYGVFKAEVRLKMANKLSVYIVKTDKLFEDEAYQNIKLLSNCCCLYPLNF